MEESWMEGLVHRKATPSGGIARETEKTETGWVTLHEETGRLSTDCLHCLKFEKSQKLQKNTLSF